MIFIPLKTVGCSNQVCLGLQHCCRVTKWNQTLCHKNSSHLWAKPRLMPQPHIFHRHLCQTSNFIQECHSSILIHHLQIPVSGGTEHPCHQQPSTHKVLGLSVLPRHYFPHRESAVEGLFRHTQTSSLPRCNCVVPGALIIQHPSCRELLSGYICMFDSPGQVLRQAANPLPGLNVISIFLLEAELSPSGVLN